MKKTLKPLGLLAIVTIGFTALSLSACFSPWHGDGMGRLAITIGGGGERASFLESVPNFEHVVTLSNGPAKDQRHQFTGKKTLYISVTPGVWDITVETYLDKFLEDGVLLASGFFEGATVKPGMNSAFSVEMGLKYDFENTFFVLNRDDYDPGAGEDKIIGSFRAAIEDAKGRWNEIKENSEPVETLTLLFSRYGGEITVTKTPITIDGLNLTIMGNGATLNGNKGAEFVRVISGNVKISRLHFTNGDSSVYRSGAIDNKGNLTLESCIFSNNAGDGNWAAGAIYNQGKADIKGCTFYDNTHIVITQHDSTSELTLTGNLFYGNNVDSSLLWYWAQPYGDVMTKSLGYNVFDSDYCGWDKDSTDQQIGNALPFSPANFRLFTGSEVTNYTFAPPPDYPEYDFHGNPIKNPAYAGAVQTTQEANGYYLNISVQGGNDRGSIEPRNADGMYTSPATFTATANEGYTFSHWLLNGEKVTGNPITLTLEDHNQKLEAVFTGTLHITNNADTVSNPAPGTLRHAIENAVDGDTISIELTGDKTITLSAPLEITKALIIEGNGTVVTGTGKTDSPSPSGGYIHLSLFSVSNPRKDVDYDDPENDQTVTISRIHFRDINMSTNGMAISNSKRYAKSILILESCIFSNNHAGSSSSDNGGAISNSDIMIIKGCTFYNNSASGVGGVIINGGNLTLEGNLFYQNTEGNYPVVCNDNDDSVYIYHGTTTSLGYNMIDVPFGTSSDQCGWEKHANDKQIDNDDIPFKPENFKLLSNSEVVVNHPFAPSPGYPKTDFYGDPIQFPAYSGAVQEKETPKYYLDLSVKGIAEKGSISPIDPDGLYPPDVTFTATPNEGCNFSHWLLNETEVTDNPISLTLTDNNQKLEAVFIGRISVNDDNYGRDLRNAIENAFDGDTISIAGGITITLDRSITIDNKNLTIEGNGAVLYGQGEVDLLSVGNNSAADISVKVSRVHFSLHNGTAVKNGSKGTVTLESCIFNGNAWTSTNRSVITNSGDMSIKGCTFCNNNANNMPNIINNSGTLNLEGNLFYKNGGKPIVVTNSATSLGHNVVDVTIGTSESGWTAGTGDKTIATDPISSLDYKLFPDSEARYAGIVSLSADYPTVDFYGNTIDPSSFAAGAVQEFIEAIHIKTRADLEAVNGNGYYILDNDIDLDGKIWTPIGNYPNNFTGTFNGNGKTISNMKIETTEDSYWGLFGYIAESGIVKNLNIKNCEIDGSGWDIGGIAGSNSGIVEYCSVSGSISGSFIIGGITGINYGQVKNCYSTANVAAVDNEAVEASAGGVAGDNSGVLKNCYATGNVTSSKECAGGITGRNTGQIENCVALNLNISGTGNVYCIARNNGGTLINNYAQEDMKVNGSVPTANIGLNDTNGAGVSDTNATNQSWWTTTSGLGWDFDNVWTFNDNGLPILRVIPATEQTHALPQE